MALLSSIRRFCNWEESWRNALLTIASFVRTIDRRRSQRKGYYWGSCLLAGVMLKGKPKKSPGYWSLPWDNYQVSERIQVHEVAEKFIWANFFNPR